MARAKMVNGLVVPLSPAEELARDAEEAAFAGEPKNPPPARDVLRLVDALEVEGVINAARAAALRGRLA